MKNTTITLSALIVAHNEEAQLKNCLNTLLFVDEVVVVLDKCTDTSKKIVESFQKAQQGTIPVKILEGSWDLEGPRRNTGIDACTSDWVLEVDADERVSDALAQEIRQLIQTTTHAWFKVPFDNYIGDTLVKHGWGGSFGVPREVALFRQKAKRWGNQRVHPAVDLRGDQGPELKNTMTHYMDATIFETLQRLQSYAEARARDYADGYGSPGSLPNNVRRFFSRFLRCYFVRQGFREGLYGVVIAVCAGLFPVLSYLRYQELKKDK